MSERLDPRMLFEMIAHDLPGELRPHVLVVGSLAAAYHFRDTIHRDGIATKDADCVIHPAGALMECQAIATQLLSDGWRRRDDCSPREQPEPDTALRAIRLNPPSTEAYFIELLAFPDVGQKEAVRWIPFQLSDGWYCLPSFRYLGLTGRDWKQAENGLHYAAPEMLALANLLAHPEVGTRKMSGQIGNRTLLRSAKDLGRVLALAWLTSRSGIEAWVQSWEEALRERFPEEAPELALSAGAGLRELLADDDALDQARHAVDVGLLAGKDVTLENLRATGQRLLDDALQPLAERLGGRASS
ncbi:MAG: hypothetical protein Q8S73_16775 [Deltaproteobacteria bacterium]|jgi:hypothetical protein|nr:hypothetical protein [Myxococcales bacterium]MDP3215763.1 hypothetical protein [Deltaproteobacteria bacterium]